MAKKSKIFDSILESMGKPAEIIVPEPGQRLRLSGKKISMSLPAQTVEVELGKERLYIRQETGCGGSPVSDVPDLVIFNPDMDSLRFRFVFRLPAGESLHISQDEPYLEHLFKQPREAFRRNFRLDHEGTNLVFRDTVSEYETYVTLLDEDTVSASIVDQRVDAIDKVIDAFGGPIEPLAPDAALIVLREVNALLEQEKFRQPDNSGHPGGLLNLPDKIAPVVIGDLHANVDNLLKILSENAFMQELDAGTAAFVFLGDLVQPDREPYDEMDSSVLMMDLLFKLKLKYPDGVFFLRGNHDSFSTEVSKDLVPQAVLWRKKLEEVRGEEYRDQMANFYELCSAVVLSGEFFACHAGPPTGKTKLDKVVNIRSHPDLLHDLMWNRIRQPGRPSGYTASDVKRFRKSLKIDKQLPFLVSHTPYTDKGALWCNVGGIENHHILYSSRPHWVSVFISVDGKMVPQLYTAEPMLDWVNARAGTRASP